MNDGLLKVNFGLLSQAGADIQKALHELDTQLGQLEADARPLVATWDSQAVSRNRTPSRRGSSGSVSGSERFWTIHRP